MKTAIFALALGLSCLLSLTDAQCDLRGKKQDVAFPDITKNVADSYIMGVEFSMPGNKETDYFTEYYDTLNQRGRVESHIREQNQVYIYYFQTWESWTIKDDKCTYNNVNETAEFNTQGMTEWLHGKGENYTTLGPSAMFKTGLDAWNNKDRQNMAYMGEADDRVRGEAAVYWRRCRADGSTVDYYFADPNEYNAFDPDDSDVLTPLRVVFNGLFKETSQSVQVYDILSFQRFIPAGVEPFQLQQGINCKRGPLFESPDPPDFSGRSLFFSAEVLYQKLNKEKRVVTSYYSTLTLAMDVESNHTAYYYSPWNTTKPDSKKTEEPFAGAPEYIIFDYKNKYKYTINLGTSKCELSREKDFFPRYKLPENGGSLTLTNPYVLFPHKELSYLTDGTDRGIPVDIFEAQTPDFMLGEDTIIPRAIISHSYLKSDEELENTVSIKYAPTQMTFRFFRTPDEEDILTMNIFGFTTKIPFRRYLFDVTRCYKNDDDYLFLSIGLEIPSQHLPKIESVLPQIERNVFSQVTTYSDLNPVRIPVVMTDLKDSFVYVTMLVLGKPPLQLDFIDKEKGKKIKTAVAEGPANFDTCAKSCLEEKADCWGFSLCGAFCNYGSQSDVTVENAQDCELFKRYSNQTMYSKEFEVNNVVKRVKSGEFLIMAFLKDTPEPVNLVASVADVTDPAEDDSLFEKMGHYLDPRMRVLKAAKRLKKGSTVKNLGRLRYDECQSVCLDFKNCETLSYCIKDSECITSDKYGTDLAESDMEANNFCVLLARRYIDHFERSPGVFIESKSGTVKTVDNVEDCARACLLEGQTGCLSFDHCSAGDKKECILYKVHYLSSKDRKASVKGQDPRCGHYTRKFSTEFKKKVETRVVGSTIPPIRNLTLEECAKTCVDYDQGTCFGYDFCQDKTLYATSCTIFDSDPSRMKTSYHQFCTNYVRAAPEYAPHPFTNSYAGGIGFLCFLVGGIIGAAIVFGIAYYRANRK